MSEFLVGQEVMIKDIDSIGFIDRKEISLQGTMYRVIHWINGDRKETWMYDIELKGR